MRTRTGVRTHRLYFSWGPYYIACLRAASKWLIEI